MIRINLLPHREAKRKQNKNAFYRLLAVAGVFAAVVAMCIWFFIGQMISNQDGRNALIKNEIKKLDSDIAEIANLKDEIAALKARQQAVEDLESDRNQPVYLFDELVKQVPEGVFLHSFAQNGQKVVLTGTAQSNERVSDLLRNMNEGSSQWLQKPELVEIKSNNLGQGRDQKKVVDFTMNVEIKRPRDEKPADAGAPAPVVPPAGAPAAGTPPAPASGAPAASPAGAPKKP